MAIYETFFRLDVTNSVIGIDYRFIELSFELSYSHFRINYEKLLYAVMKRPPKIKHPLVLFTDMEWLLHLFKYLVITSNFNAVVFIFDFIEHNSLFLVPSEAICHTYHTKSHSWREIFIHLMV